MKYTWLLFLIISIPLIAQVDIKNQTEEELNTKKFNVIKEVWARPFKSQGETRTCWCFATTSFLESEAHRLGRGDFEISQMDIVYNSYIEKAIRYIRSHTENPFRPGGLSHDVIYLIEKYGALPRESYLGNKDYNNKYDHREMNKVLSGMMSGVSDAGKLAPLNGRWIDGQFSWYWLSGFTGLLDAYLGKPPDSIEYNGKNLTPRQFSNEILNLPLDDFIEITSYSQFPFYSTSELLLPDNWLHYNKYYNVPLNDFKRIIDHSLENGYSLCADLHVKEDELISKKNFLLSLDVEKDIQITQYERDALFDNWRIEDIHLEHIIGIAQDEKGKKFYKAKDSIGSDDDEGPLHNKEFLSENFIESRVLFILVHKNGVPDDIALKLGIK
jgi:bleomycin hydrolase